ncbi:MAG: ATP-binding protein [Verrucomicrobiales bacterium]|nr:ATP-binding protein [Verrucomicrobiales bacterium]
MSEQKTDKNFTLARNLAIWIGLFFLISSILFLSWTSRLNRIESLARFKELAETNAAFIEDLRYPKSPRLASQLSNILDMGVGFYRKDQANDRISIELRQVIVEMTSEPGTRVREIENEDIAISPLSDSDEYLVLIRPRESRDLLTPTFLIPIVILAVGCATLAFVFGLNIVKPLRALTHWLPNLKQETAVSDMPASVLQRNDEIGHLARALIETRESLHHEKELRLRSERLAALGRVATSLAHEVKNPAAAIRLHADLMAENASGETLESVEMIKGEVDQISDLVNQWLYVAKTRPAKLKPCDLNDLISQVCARLEAQAIHAGSQLTLQLSEDSLSILADSSRIEQVIRNLVLNSIQAMPDGGEIVVKTSSTGEGFAIVEISDNGPGFSAEALKRFGEPFYTEKEGGMGIGLTLSKDLTESHGGTISARNHTGRNGATITITLPLYRS